MNSKFSQHNLSIRAFTLIELMVVFAVSATIALVVIGGYPDFERKTEFENLALDISLTIREAQVYGMGVKRENSAGFDIAYGVRFDISTPNTFVLFADKNGDDSYDSGEEISTLTIKNIFKISDLCTDASCASTASTMDVTFRRPNPDAIIIPDGSSSVILGVIKVENINSGKKKVITVTDTGQISVQ